MDLSGAKVECLNLGQVLLPKCYVINLDSRPDKWNIVSSRLIASGFQPIRWSAKDGRDVEVSDVETKYPLSDDWADMTPGQIGCALSHLEILQHMKRNNIETCTVFEDDAVLSANFHAVAGVMGFPVYLDVAWMGSDTASMDQDEIHGCFCTHGMIYRRSFVDKVLNEIQEHGLYAIDIIYKRMQMESKMKYAIWPGKPTPGDIKTNNLYLSRCGGVVYQDLTLSTDIWAAKCYGRFGYSDIFSKGRFFNFVNDPDRCRTFVINLDRSKDRYQHFILGAQDAGFHHIERFSAIDKLSPDFAQLRQNHPYKKDSRPNGRIPQPKPDWTNYEDMSDGQVACALSHLALMEQCIRDNKTYVVFEDDATFIKDFEVVAEEYWRRTPPGTQLIMMGHNLETPCGDRYVTRTPTWNMHAYLYTPLFCRAFIDYINRSAGLFCVDINLIEFQSIYPHYAAWLNEPTPDHKDAAHVHRCGGLVHQKKEFGTLL